MSHAAKTVFFFGCYLIVLGAALLLVPNVLIALFQFPRTSEVWVHVTGMLTLFLGVYDMAVARLELRPLMMLSALRRATVIIFFLAFVVSGLAPVTFLFFGALDLACGVWTWRALQSETSGT